MDRDIYSETLRTFTKLCIRNPESVFTHLIYHRLSEHHGFEKKWSRVKTSMSMSLTVEWIWAVLEFSHSKGFGHGNT